LKFDLDSFFGRILAQIYAMTIEHNITNVFRDNFYKIDEYAFRSSQPTTYQLRRIIKKHGIKTVINLRGYKDGSAMRALEERVCEEHGVEMVYLEAYSRRIPSAQTLQNFKDTFERVNYPILIHCKSGADRAGLGSMLYLYFMRAVLPQQSGQLKFWPYGHISIARMGLIDLFVKLYANRGEDEPSDLIEFASKLDRKKVESEFRASSIADKFVDCILRRE